MHKSLSVERVVGGRYRVVRLLEEVSADVTALYEAEDTVTGQRCALRVFDPAVAEGTENRRRWDAVCRVRASVRSNHVVQLLSAGIDSELPWMALEWLEGNTLAETLADAGDDMLEGAEEIVEEVAGALAAIHSAGCTHGSLDPGRVFLARRNLHGRGVDAMLLDFWTRELSSGATDQRRDQTMESTAGVPDGTPAQTDVFSLGMLAFRLIAGVPYHTPAERTEAAPPASERARALGGEELWDGFDDWFARCTTATEKRYPSAAEAYDAWGKLWDSDDADTPVADDATDAPFPSAPDATEPPTRAEPWSAVLARRFPGAVGFFRDPNRAVPTGLAVALLLAFGVRAELRHHRGTHGLAGSMADAQAFRPPAPLTRPTDPMPTWQARSDGEIVYPNVTEPTSPDPLDGRWALVDATAGMPPSGPLTADIETSMGTLSCALFPDRAPLIVANFIGLARGIRPWWDPVAARWVRRPYYDGSVFHKIVPGMWIQGGDILRSGGGGTGYTLHDEDTTPHDQAGLLVMANHGPDTNGSQFFILATPRPGLDGRYPIVGQCGPMDIVHQIENVPINSGRPRTPVYIRHITIHRG